MTSTTTTSNTTLVGGCDCQTIRYQLLTRPLFTHCCHCTWCQRESGSAFAVNAVYETPNVKVTSTTQPEIINTPSASGSGQMMARCPKCRICVWSNYGGSADRMRFIRVGTLDESDLLAPDIHIYTSTKLPWVSIGDGKPEREEFYDRREYWPVESLERLERYYTTLASTSAKPDAPV